MLRRGFIPPVVLHENPNGTREILDGRQRINILRNFLQGKTQIPYSLAEVPQYQSLVGRELIHVPLEIQNYVHAKLTLHANIIKGINDEQIHRLFFDLHPNLRPAGGTYMQVW